MDEGYTIDHIVESGNYGDSNMQFEALASEPPPLLSMPTVIAAFVQLPLLVVNFGGFSVYCGDGVCTTAASLGMSAGSNSFTIRCFRFGFAIPNQTLKGFDKIDLIKEEVEQACPGIVFYADIIALASRDIVLLEIKVSAQSDLRHQVSLVVHPIRNLKCLFCFM
ncbi:unnamed protein product [Trifolium pratense]|uniref:Uncharacterized protein n=1 Tax=Trifolium pratense TaxID=57577 RepID=A0ACB0KKA8_TRIPR|nr:unnamed protein product [Trifolium pratense]